MLGKPLASISWMREIKDRLSSWERQTIRCIPKEADHLCLSLEGIRELPRDKIGHFRFITWQKTLAYLLVFHWKLEMAIGLCWMKQSSGNWTLPPLLPSPLATKTWPYLWKLTPNMELESHETEKIDHLGVFREIR